MLDSEENVLTIQYSDKAIQNSGIEIQHLTFFKHQTKNAVHFKFLHNLNTVCVISSQF